VLPDQTYQVQVATPELAATRIQATARMWLARRLVARLTAEEDLFLGITGTVRLTTADVGHANVHVEPIMKLCKVSAV